MSMDTIPLLGLKSKFNSQGDNFKAGKNKKLGAFLGVYVPSILGAFGVIVFERMGWLTAQVGSFDNEPPIMTSPISEEMLWPFSG